MKMPEYKLKVLVSKDHVTKQYVNVHSGKKKQCIGPISIRVFALNLK